MMGDAESELRALKSLVLDFLKEIEWVPFRPADCDQAKVHSLTSRLVDACKQGSEA